MITLYKFALFELIFSNKNVYIYLGEKHIFKSMKCAFFKKSLTEQIRAVSPDTVDSLAPLQHLSLSTSKPEKHGDGKIPEQTGDLEDPASSHTMWYWAYYSDCLFIQ